MSDVVAKMDWRELYAFAKKQAIVGFCFEGIDRLGNEDPEELRLNPIGQDLLMEWMGMAQRIRRQNMKVNAVAAQLFAQLRKDGLRCCILKGQGNALMYPNPYSRTPGDIDVWVNDSRERITEYAKGHFALEDDIRFHHLETAMDGVLVELHFMPCVMNNVVYNRRLQKWFRRNADLQCSNVVRLPDGAGEIAVPTTAFNVVYQLTHLYHHFFDEGIGMRQIIDYYFVINDLFSKGYLSSSNTLGTLSKERIFPTTPSLLHKEGSTSFPKPLSPHGTGDVAGDAIALPEFWYRQRSSRPQGAADDCLTQQSSDCLCGVTPPCSKTAENATDTTDATTIVTATESTSTVTSAHETLEVLQRDLKQLGLWKFAGAVMYVLHETLGLSEEKMIAPMDEKRGKLLLEEILNGGNFGKHFSKYGHFTQQGMAKKYFLKIWRNMHFVRYYPAEALSEPIFRTLHFLWRKWNKK